MSNFDARARPVIMSNHNPPHLDGRQASVRNQQTARALLWQWEDYG
jgi:hypothetical protein